LKLVRLSPNQGRNFREQNVDHRPAGEEIQHGLPTTLFICGHLAHVHRLVLLDVPRQGARRPWLPLIGKMRDLVMRRMNPIPRLRPSPGPRF
jgi:hypothetical protein